VALGGPASSIVPNRPPRPLNQVTLGKKLALNASALGAGRVLMALTGVVTVGIATRYLGLAGYGDLTAATAFVTALAPLADVGLSTIAAREIARRPDEAERLVRSVLTLALGLSLVGLAIGLAAANLIYMGDAHSEIRGAITLMLVLGLPLAGPMVAATGLVLAQQRAWMLVVASVSGSLVTLTVVALASALDWGFYGIVVAYAGTGLGYGVALLVLTARGLLFRPLMDLELARQLFRAALPLGLAAVITSFYWRLDIILLSLLGSEAEVGLYGLAYKLVDAFLTVPWLVTLTLMPELARMAEDPQRLQGLVERAFRSMQFFVLPLVVCGVVFADEIIEIVAGQAFEDAAGLLRILFFGVAAVFLSAVLTQALIATNRQATLLIVTTVVLGVLAGLCFALIPPFGATGAAVAFVASEVAALVALTFLYGRTARVPRPDLRPPLLIATSVMVAVALVKLPLAELSVSPGIILGVGGAMAVSAYVACLYWLHAMPAEIHNELVLPVWTRLRRAWR
jgi:O-antigen/teichoic acid export membrane protein